MLTHETSPVLGASVIGMTIRVGQGQSHLPDNVPGISTVLSQEDRLRPKDRLHQQPAGDFTEESQSRRRQQNSSNDCFAKRSLAPIRSTEVGDKGDASHARSPPINGQEPSPRKDQAERRAYASEMPVHGGKALYKVVIVRQGVRGRRVHVKTMATEEPTAGQPDTKPVTRPPPI
jgi:hypothetical protein